MAVSNKGSTPSASSGARDREPFDYREADDFYKKSLSEHTRRAYARVIREFFIAHRNTHPDEITTKQILAWRDNLVKKKQKPNTVAFKLAVVRTFFEYLRAAGTVEINPANTRLAPPPALPETPAGRALNPEQVERLLAGPDRSKPEGARDYALMLTMLRLSLRVNEVCSLRSGSITRSNGRWIVTVKVKGGRERTLPMPDDVCQAIKDYLELDRNRRRNLHSHGENAYLFQPITNYRTREFNKPLSDRMVRNIVARWWKWCGLSEDDKIKLSPHDLRRTAITHALDQGLSYRQVQMMSGHRDPKTVMRYDHGQQNLELNAVNFLDYSGKK